MTTDPNRLAYLSSPMTRDVRLSGTPKVSVKAAFQGGRSPYLTALLVDYGTDARAYGSVVYGATPVCYGQGVPGDTGCARLAEHVTVTAPYKIITRGWLDVRNRESVSRTELLREGRFHDFDVDLQPNDYIVKAATGSVSCSSPPTATSPFACPPEPASRSCPPTARSRFPWSAVAPPWISPFSRAGRRGGADPRRRPVRIPVLDGEAAR
ncbi:CocE/NonD family hydrolase C-terminal non-catalytic domain-containing protein [Streptosporangium lutulentum]